MKQKALKIRKDKITPVSARPSVSKVPGGEAQNWSAGLRGNVETSQINSTGTYRHTENLVV